MKALDTIRGKTIKSTIHAYKYILNTSLFTPGAFKTGTHLIRYNADGRYI